MKTSTLRNAIGPGLLMAGAAVGVSHLVQSTRAGAEYGLALLGLVLLGCVLKYPFLEFGPRYAAATGEHMIRGYQRLGKWPLGLFVFLTLATMFIVLASVTIVTAGLAGALFGLKASVATLAFFILLSSALILTIGNYRGLDFLMKIIMAVLSLATLVAVMLAAVERPDWSGLWAPLSASNLLSGAGLAFALALLGWMPIPLDAAAWHSLWTLERARETGSRPSVAHASADFRIGYAGAVVLAVAFMMLGALVMHDGNRELAGSAVGFSTQLIEMYTDALGAWARPLIAFAALATMMSTTLAVADAYPRALRAILELGDPNPETHRRRHRARYLAGMLVTMLGAWLIIALFGRQFTLLIDFTTTPDFSDAVKEFTNKKGVDLILDHVGAKYLKPNMNSLGYKGKLVVIGVISGIKAELNLALMMVKRQQIIGSVLRSRPVPEKGEIIAEFTRRALPKFADRTIVPIIEKVFPLEEVVEAHRMMEADKHFGKIVLKVADA